MRFDEMTPERRREISLRGAQARRDSARAAQGKPLPRVCKRGHDLTGENALHGFRTRKQASGETYQYEYLNCKACENERRRKQYYQKKHIGRGA